MDERALISRLAELESPEAEPARKRAVAAVPRRVRAAGAGGGGRIPWPSAQIATAAVALLLGIAGLALLTPPGQAVTSWVGDRLGIGEPGGEPSLQELRSRSDRGTPAEGRPARVLHVGPAPGGRYEFLTYRPRVAEDGAAAGTRPVGEPCFEVDLTQLRTRAGQDCGVLPGGPNLYLTTGVAGGDEGTVFFSGRTSESVSEVEASLDGEPVEVELAPIPLELVERLDLGRTFNFFIAFVDAPRGGGITVTARDSSGRILARQDAALPDLAGARSAICEMAKRLLREGVGSRERALESVRESCPAPPEG